MGFLDDQPIENAWYLVEMVVLEQVDAPFMQLEGV